MAWQSMTGMSGGGNGGGNGSVGGDVAQQVAQPQGTEYTLQGTNTLIKQGSKIRDANCGYLGVMRFLQTEWHRHERDRNGWEIERQEMKGRIAKLEGATRKADSSIGSLKKYINMLEKALKERDAQVRALKSGGDVKVELAKDAAGKPAVARKRRKSISA